MNSDAVNRLYGYELLRSFRAHPACSEIPVVIVTSSDAPKDRERAEALGATRYFRKPSDLAEFMAIGQIILQVAEKDTASRPSEPTPQAHSQ